MNKLSILDLIIVFLTLSITVFSVYWGQRKKSKQDDSFLDLILMGRKLTTPMFVATLVATWYGGIFGTAQIAFEQGMYNLITQGFFWYITYLFFAFFLINKIKKDSAITLADLVGKIYGSKSQKVTSIFNIINLVPISYVISIGLLGQLIFDAPMLISMILGTAFVLLYSIWGGMRSVVYSDIIQFFVMCFSVIFLLIYSIYNFGIEPLEMLDSSYFKITGKSSILETLSWGLIAISTLVDPNFYQRSFAAKNKQTARNGIIISVIVWVIFDLSVTFGALYAVALKPDYGPEYGYFMYALDVLPNGLKGFFLAGIIATVLSTLDSYIFLAATTYSCDIKKQRSIGKHHLYMLSTALVAIVLAQFFDGNIKLVWKTLGSLSTSALLVPVLYGLFSSAKKDDYIFLYSASFGTISVVSWKLFGFDKMLGVDEIYVGVIASSIGLLISRILQKQV